MAEEFDDSRKNNVTGRLVFKIKSHLLINTVIDSIT